MRTTLLVVMFGIALCMADSKDHSDNSDNGDDNDDNNVGCDCRDSVDNGDHSDGDDKDKGIRGMRGLRGDNNDKDDGDDSDDGDKKGNCNCNKRTLKPITKPPMQCDCTKLALIWTSHCQWCAPVIGTPIPTSQVTRTPWTPPTPTMPMSCDCSRRPIVKHAVCGWCTPLFTVTSSPATLPPITFSPPRLPVLTAQPTTAQPTVDPCSCLEPPCVGCPSISLPPMPTANPCACLEPPCLGCTSPSTFNNAAKRNRAAERNDVKAEGVNGTDYAFGVAGVFIGIVVMGIAFMVKGKVNKMSSNEATNFNVMPDETEINEVPLL